MLKHIRDYLKGKILQMAIILICVCVLGLGVINVISWNNPVEKVAEEVLEFETGIKVEPDNSK